MRDMRAPHANAVTVPVTVEFEDVDAYGIANHARIVSYLERARVRFFAALGVELLGGDAHMVLYDLAVRYKKPAALLDSLEVTCWPKAVDELRLVLAYSVRRGGRLVATATTALAFVDAATKAFVPVPRQLRRALDEAPR
jgi:acyl-CoA thioester hydrolase